MKKLFNTAKVLVLGTTLVLGNYSAASTPAEISETYINIAHQLYADSLSLAEVMAEEIEKFLAEPSEENLQKAKEAWTEARIYYSQTEVFRFSNAIVDDWEPQLNAWPLDEGFIDYVDDSNYFYELGNPVGKANIIASEKLRWGPNELDLTTITPEILASLNELGGTEANVATGWHAIEFLLWGQDLNGTEPGAGKRATTDFALGDNCTNDNCDRRREYLKAATDLLIEDLKFMVPVWDLQQEESYAREFIQLDEQEQLRRILYGMGSLALGELAGERMKVALLANSVEDEHDCFSDTTHNTLFNNAKGIDNVLRGSYTGPEGNSIQGASLLAWAEQNQEDLATSLDKTASDSLTAIEKIVVSAEEGTAFDQLIAPGNSEGAAMINASIDALQLLTRDLELLTSVIGIGSLNPDDAGHEF